MALVLVLSLAGLGRAQTKTEQPAAAGAKKPAEKAAQPAAPGGAGAQPAAPPAPTPAAEVAEAAKKMAGSWKCDGKVPEGMMGPAHATSATMTWKLDLDKFWMVGSYAEKKTKDNPMPYKFVEYRTYNTATKKWNRVSVGNMGDWGEDMATAAEGEKVTWEGKGHMGAMTMWGRTWEEAKGPKEVHVWGEFSMDGKKYQPAFDVTCKK